MAPLRQNLGKTTKGDMTKGVVHKLQMFVEEKYREIVKKTYAAEAQGKQSKTKEKGRLPRLRTP